MLIYWGNNQISPLPSTGSNLSEIFGTLGVNGNANLFLINPNGIIFGENASLDVGGSFAASTADAIQFGVRGFFSATEPEQPPLLTVKPSAFFFNQINSGKIENRSTAPAGVDLLGEPLSLYLVYEFQMVRVCYCLVET